MLGNHQVEPTDMPYMIETHEWRAVLDETYGYLKNKSGGWDGRADQLEGLYLDTRLHGKTTKKSRGCFQKFTLRTR